MNFHKKIITSIPLLLIFFLTGCFALPSEAVALPPPVITVPEPPLFSTVPVARGTVQMIADVHATYVPGIEERLYFAETGIPILGIFVTAGDHVQAGDIVAALDIPEIGEELEALTQRRDGLALALRHTEERHATALAIAEITGNPVDDLQFIQRRADLLSELGVVDMYILYLRRRDEARYLRSPINGVVSRATTFLFGMETHARRQLVVIADHDYTAFVVRNPMAEYLHPGDYHYIIINGNSYLMQVVDPDEVGFTRSDFSRYEAFLVFIDTPPSLSSGATGSVQIDFGQVHDVLYVPTTVLRRAGEERAFVYVLEDGLRTIRDVEVGLVGNEVVEILSGLEEGELVIR